MLQDKVNQFVDKTFIHEGKLHVVEVVKEVNLKLMLKTNRKTFVFEIGEIDGFLELIEFLDSSQKDHLRLSKNEILTLPKVVNIEIIKANNLAGDITEKLKQMFDVLAEKPTDAAFKKADAMVRASNAIVNVQMANYKFLTLKDR